MTIKYLKADGKGVVLVYEGDKNNNRRVDDSEIVVTELKGNGDFRSDECIEYLKQADVVVTNPPFSLFREYVAQLMEYNKKFIIIGNMNAITYKEIFPYIKNDELWFGASIHSGDRKFYVPENYPLDAATCGIDKDGRRFVNVKGVRWFTNVENKNRFEFLDLYKKYNEKDFPKYDNYDAIEVSKTCDIPMDYNGVMGVPITFLDKYCPNQFEIIGGFNGYKECDYKNALLCGTKTEYVDKSGVTKVWTGPTINKKTVYFRILIRRK